MDAVRAGEAAAGSGRADSAAVPKDLSVAVVIPVLGDGDAVERLLNAMAGWTVPPAEIVVASGAPDAALARLCRERGCRYVEAPANRGAQLDLGARASTAPVLWFLHADAAVPPDALAVLARAIARGFESGCFRFAFQGEPTWYKRLIAWLVGARVKAGGTPYGDQALFATRAAYDACGGFPHQPLFEEVRLVKRLRRRGTFRVLPASVGVSTRRWERDGWARRTLENRWLALRYALGTPPERLAAAYGPLNETREPKRRDA
ncbi:MAG TPA: TIGR04283 family arsenosugar biosynthesis glycosyltransferase [Gammaproteobacteria bacterium]